MKESAYDRLSKRAFTRDKDGDIDGVADGDLALALSYINMAAPTMDQRKCHCPVLGLDIQCAPCCVRTLHAALRDRSPTADRGKSDE